MVFLKGGDVQQVSFLNDVCGRWLLCAPGILAYWRFTAARGVKGKGMLGGVIIGSRVVWASDRGYVTPEVRGLQEGGLPRSHRIRCLYARARAWIGAYKSMLPQVSA